MLYYYFTPDLEYLGENRKTILIIINDHHTATYSSEHVGDKKIATVLGILKGGKQNAVLNLHNEDESLRNLAMVRIKHGAPIYNAYEYFNTIKGVTQHFLDLL